jgi:hypothetical protein
MALDEQGQLAWIKARQSMFIHACVELAPAGDMIALRDSKNPDVHLLYTQKEFAAFLDAAKRGEFDHLVRV